MASVVATWWTVRHVVGLAVAVWLVLMIGVLLAFSIGTSPPPDPDAEPRRRFPHRRA